MGCVYLARNIVNGKGYVGKTVESLEGRKTRHKEDVGGGSALIFHRALRKYGWDAFEWSVLEEDGDNEFLCFMERRWIKKLGTKSPGGYNMTDGGEGCLGYKHSDESRLRMSVYRKGKSMEDIYGENAEAVRAKRSAVLLGRSYEDIYGEDADKERKKRSVTHKGRVKSESHCQNIKETMLKLWQDPEYRKRMSEAHRHPYKSKIEKVLDEQKPRSGN